MYPVGRLRFPVPFIAPLVPAGLVLVSVSVGCALCLSVARAGTDKGIADAPLNARSAPAGPTMFVQVPAERSQVHNQNNYDDPAMWGDRDKEFALGSIGTGVAVGDYDNDGRPDLFVVNKVEPCRLYRNLGDWRFEDVTESAGLGEPDPGWRARIKAWFGRGGAQAGIVWKQGASFADVNNDGWLDLYLCRFGLPNRLYVNQGDGTFREEAAARGLAISDGSGVGAFCDYDRDGWIDVYIQTNLLDHAAHPDGQRDRLLHNNGDGTFTEVTSAAGIRGETLAHSATWWDYDADGWPDLYVANDFAAPDNLYHNNGDGTFTDRIDDVVPHTPYSAMGSDLGDVNNDGWIDFLVADMAATTHEKDQRSMASSRELTRPAAGSHAPQLLRNALYLATGTGRCLEAAALAGVAATDWTWSVRFEDFDNDGRLDLHVTNGMVREFHNADLRDRLVVAENVAEARRIVRESPELAESNLAFRNLGELRFENVSAAWGLDETGVSFGAATADFDGDGDLDLVYANYRRSVSLLCNDCASGHRVIVALRGTRSNRCGVGAVVRIESASGVQVRQLVNARGYLSSSEPIVHFGLGEDARIERLTVSWPSGQVQTFTELPVDRRFTITEPSGPIARPGAPGDTALAETAQFVPASSAMNLVLSTRERNLPDSNRQPLAPWRFDRVGPALAAGDLDGDGRDDLVLGATSASPARMVLREKSGSFAPPVLLETANATSGLEGGPLLIFDADGDGRNDILPTRGGAALPANAAGYQPVLLFNDGRGGFRLAPSEALPPLRASAGALAAADFDRDGRLDVFFGARLWPGKYPLPPSSVLLANRGGRFEDVTDALAPGLREIGLVTAALWSDVDDDGWIDLLIAPEWGGVRYWHNEAGRGFVDRSEPAGFGSAGSGWWTSLAAADFNNDGRLDYAAGNVGLNTPYRADRWHPALLYYGDFGGVGEAQLVEAYYEGEHIVPWRINKALGARIPEIRRRYPRANDYARATVPEILGPERLEKARRFAATELRSGVFLSQPDGRFQFAPLPRLAQIAPLQGLGAGDFDGDGLADLYAVQNSFAPTPVVGRFDGGLSQLLRGDGRGSFVPVPPRESGLVVPGEAKALIVLDFDEDGWPDFVVSRNDSTTMAFRNRGVGDRHSLCVRLRGRPGNESAVGARLALELADGAVQVGEIHAGSGRFSQSAACCFFGYTESHPPRRLRVRWPWGETTRHEIDAPGPHLVIVAP